MDLKRFFVFEDILGSDIILKGNEFYHAIKVTRHKVGYKLIISDNKDKDYYCTITKINSDNLIAHIDEIKLNDKELRKDILLFIGINKEIDTSVQKAVELGVNRIYPIITKHGNENSINKERLQRIILESAKQCGRSKLPTLNDVIDFTAAINVAKDTKAFLFYEFEEDRKVSSVSQITEDMVSVIIGSEGGFSLEEIAMCRENNIETYTLGKRILRVNTALVSALTLVIDKVE
ncbi:MAG: RsmE family RNA methyltransferase [Clostridia bacterium]